MIDRKTRRKNQATWQEGLDYYRWNLAKAKDSVRFWEKEIKIWEAHPPKAGDIYNKRQDV